MTMDRDHHIIICRAADGSLYIPECKPGQTLRQVAELIRSGEYERVVSVIAFNPVEGWSQVRTEDTALEVAALGRDEGALPRSAIEFIDRYAGLDVGDKVRYLEVA